MKYYFNDPEYPVVFQIPAQDFVNFNIAENFDHKPTNRELLELFRDLPINFIDWTDSVDLAQAVKQACLAINGIADKDNLDKLELILLSKIEPTKRKVEDMDDYDHWTLQELKELWK